MKGDGSRGRKLRSVLTVVSLLFGVPVVARCAVLQELALDAETTCPESGAAQYVGVNYSNGGSYDIKVEKTEVTSGDVWVWCHWGTCEVATWGTKNKFQSKDIFCWKGSDTGCKEDDGTIYETVCHEACEAGQKRTWRTYADWVGRQWNGTSWVFLSSDAKQDDNDFYIVAP